MNAAQSAPGSELLDPTGEVNLEDPAAIEAAMRRILDANYGSGGYDGALLAQAVRDVVAAYRGRYPGLLRCDTLYHDLRHALETGLTVARLVDGHAKSPAHGGAERIDGDQALACVLLALFHDVGLLRRDTEGHVWGPSLIPIHEERGVEFMQDYLEMTTLAHLAGQSRLIMATKLIFIMPSAWTAAERTVASLVASADILCQCSDRCYLEKCRDFLFTEFTAFGLAGKADSPYPDRETLLAKTPEFFAGIVRQRLEHEFGGVYRLLETHTGRGNPWTDAIEHNLGYLQALLDAKALSRLRRQPRPFI